MALPRISFLLLFSLLAASCSRGNPLTLPPLVSQPSSTLPGKFVWHNLITPDAEAAREFYSAVFGWELETMAGGAYTTVSRGGRALGGIVDASKQENPPRSSVWLAGVSVPNVDDMVSQAVGAGAKQIMAPTDISDVGRIAVIIDPDGAVLQLIDSKDGDPPDTPALENTWLWHEMISDDPAASAEFYRSLLGYEVTALGAEDPSYQLLSRDGVPRAGIFENPFEDTRPAWVPYIRVENPSALLPKVEANGGRVIIQPSEKLRAGTVALILDPSGAPIALQKWEPIEQGAAK
jgi:predicted enzyme related to lactoylglutathione lyase